MINFNPLSGFVLTKAQRAALFAVYNIASNVECVRPYNGTYRQFRRTVSYHGEYIMVYAYGLWLGIETDGHTHS